MASLREIVPDLPAEHADNLTAVADNIESEANRENPDQTWLLRLTERARSILAGAQGIAAVPGLIEQANQAIGQLSA